jgi:hypothetical protein
LLPGKYDFIAFQGSSFDEVIELHDSSGAIDLTGHTITGQVKKNISDKKPVLTITCTLLNQTTNRGQVRLQISAADMETVVLQPQTKALREFEDFCYDLKRVDTLGEKHRDLEGLFKISPEVTRG